MEFQNSKQQVPRLIAANRENPEFHLFKQGVLGHFGDSGVIHKVTNIDNATEMCYR